VTLYAESSAVLAWLLGEPRGAAMAGILRAADAVATSELTLIECDRVLLRSGALGRLAREEVDDRRARLTVESTLWSVLGMTADVIDRARAPFTDDTIRALDAIHLATAVVLQRAGVDIEMLSLDARIRATARQLDFGILPD
jgi:predicted nucleic acid-binding protein